MKTIAIFLMILSYLTLTSCNENRSTTNDSKVEEETMKASISIVNEIMKIDLGKVYKAKSETFAKLIKDSTTDYNLIYELRIFITGFEKPIIDTIKTDLIRGVVADTILYSKTNMNVAQLKTFEFSSDKKDIILGYSIRRSDYEYNIEYKIRNDLEGIRGELKNSGFTKKVETMTIEIKDAKISKK